MRSTIWGRRLSCSGSIFAAAPWCSFRVTNLERLAGMSFGEYQALQFPRLEQRAGARYLVKPVGYLPGQQYPVVLLIHGGPESSLANEFHYRWNPQTYAGAGYAW